MIIDGRRYRGELPTGFDVCVVGSGPAGLAVARRLAGRGHRVAVIEAGGFRPTVRGQRMLVDRPEGYPYWELQDIRVRMVGGSGNRWGGICRPLDPIDLESRSWVELSGWPIDWTSLHGYYAEAATELDLTDDDFSRRGRDMQAALPPQPADGEFTLAHYRLSPDVAMGADSARPLSRSPNITLITNTDVVGFDLGADRASITAARTQTMSGRRSSVTARQFVLAAGAVENARLLLADEGRTGAGLGNEHDLVGRYFMEHIHVPLAYVNGLADPTWSSYHHLVWPRLCSTLVPRPDVQRSAELLNAALSIGPPSYFAEAPLTSWDYRIRTPLEDIYRRLTAGDVERLRRVQSVVDRIRAVHALARAPFGRSEPEPPDTASLLYYRGEQPPRWENRVVLTDRRDELGRRRAHLEWTVGDQETKSAAAVLDMFANAARRHGWCSVDELPDWPERIIGGPHHMGTTRMAAHPSEGVVDENCRVHSVANLYVAGSSVFPTGGHANPTLTLVALSLRLADHLLGSAR